MSKLSKLVKHPLWFVRDMRALRYLRDRAGLSTSASVDESFTFESFPTKKRKRKKKTHTQQQGSNIVMLPNMPAPTRTDKAARHWQQLRFRLGQVFPPHDTQRLLPRLLIGVPMVVATLYLGLIAADRYVTESKIIVKHISGSESAEKDINTVLTGGYSIARDDVLYLKEYIFSLDMLQRLEQSLNMREAFRQAGLDMLYRLSPDVSQEEFLDYYRKRVEVIYDDATAMLTVRTEGFTPEFSQQLNQAILSESEAFINRISHQMAQEQMNFASQEVDRNRSQLNNARDNLLAFQNTHGILDPTAHVEAAGRVIAEMEAQRTQLEAELRQLRTYLNENTAQITAKKNLIAALEAQIAKERSKLAAPDGDKMNTMAAQYQEAKATVEFNVDLYKLSLNALEETRTEAVRKLKNLVIIAAPQLPQDAERPRKLVILATLFIITLFIYGSVNLGWAIIKEHRE